MTDSEKLKDIQEHPEKHLHDFNSLTTCCMVDGAFAIRLMDAHAGLAGWNGSKCDVKEGPCSCGAWH